MKFKVGDRVKHTIYNRIGTVTSRRKVKNSIFYIVTDSKKERMICQEKHLESVDLKSDPDFASIWDKNSK